MNFLQPKTVEGVLASFQRTIDNLKAIAETQDDLSQSAYLEHQRQERIADSATAEAVRAKAIADKIETLIAA